MTTTTLIIAGLVGLAGITMVVGLIKGMIKTAFWLGLGAAILIALHMLGMF